MVMLAMKFAKPDYSKKVYSHAWVEFPGFPQTFTHAMTGGVHDLICAE